MIAVKVPASSGNLGPGFDTLGLALALYDEIEIEVTGRGLTIEVTGESAGSVPRDERHLVVRALSLTLDALGVGRPGLAVRCRNRIPHERGLGSSAAATVAGVAAGYAIAGVSLDDAERAGRALRLAASIEGHADNAAPSLLGGLTISWSTAETGWQAVRVEPCSDLSPLLLVPATTSATALTRRLLPDKIPHADAVFTAGRVALAVLAISSRPELLLSATEDRLHQPYRRSAYPLTARLVDELRAAGVAAVVSGAGPTVLAITAGRPLPGTVDLTGFTPVQIPVERAGVHVRRC